MGDLGFWALAQDDPDFLALVTPEGDDVRAGELLGHANQFVHALRAQGLSEEDIFDLAETAAFFNLSNRMASATDMMPNPEYHRLDR